jgi:pilus assembly protein TadC
MKKLDCIPKLCILSILTSFVTVYAYTLGYYVLFRNVKKTYTTVSFDPDGESLVYKMVYSVIPTLLLGIPFSVIICIVSSFFVIAVSRIYDGATPIWIIILFSVAIGLIGFLSFNIYEPATLTIEEGAYGLTWAFLGCFLSVFLPLFITKKKYNF